MKIIKPANQRGAAVDAVVARTTIQSQKRALPEVLLCIAAFLLPPMGLAQNIPPVAMSDNFSTPANRALAVAAPGVLANDTDANGDPLSVTGVTGPTYGLLETSPDGHFTYTPAADFYGLDEFTYSISDSAGGSATATVTIEVVLTEPGIYVCELPDFGGGYSDAYAMNESWLVVGASRYPPSEYTIGLDHAFLYNDYTKDMMDLGTLAGRPVSHAYDINASGWVVGICYPVGRPWHRAFRIIPQDADADGTPDTWFAGEGSINTLMTDLGDLGGDYSMAFCINDEGLVVGQSQTASGHWHACLWMPSGEIVDLGTLGGAESSAHEIISGGIIAGTSETASGETHAFVLCPADSSGDGMPDTWCEDVGGVNTLMIDLGTPLAAADLDVRGVRSVNNLWQVAVRPHMSGMGYGYIGNEGSGWTEVDTLGGSSTPFLTGMNDLGQISGGSYTHGDAHFHAYLGTITGGLVDLGALDANHNSYALDLNASGDMLAGLSFFLNADDSGLQRSVGKAVVWHIIPNTVEGSDIVVERIDKLARVKFKKVVKKGYTKLIEKSPEEVVKSAEFPSGHEPVGSAVEISSSATFEEYAEVTLKYDPSKVANEGKLSLWHLKKRVWVKLASGIDLVEKCVMAKVDSFSPFIVLEQINTAPVLGAIEAPAEPIPLGAAVQALAGFTDGDSSDTHAALWDWGDGTGSSGEIVEVGGSGTVTGSHLYTSAGVYIVTLTLTDSGSASASAQYEYVVVFDPTGGFVTGGGWIWSPAGALIVQPTLIGKATFGFVSKYQKGANVPSGNTEFQFKAGELNFKSTAYQWLVIAGARGQFKGTGTVNGMDGYGFMLTAIDGDLLGGAQPDRFRIKIWEITTGVVVYDNQPATDDAADLTTDGTVVQGGSVVVHK